MIPEMVVIGPLLVPVFKVGILVALFLSVWLSGRLARQLNIESIPVTHIAEILVWGGLLSSRIGFAVVNWSAYSSKPWTILYVWQPGYDWLSGLSGGILVALFLFWKSRSASLNKEILSVVGGFGAGSLVLIGLIGLNYYSSANFQKSDVYSTGEMTTSVLKRGDRVPDFILADLEGNAVQFSSFENKLVILNFWATWCPPCRREMPTLETFQQENKNNHVVVVGINVGENSDVVSRYILKSGFTYPILVDLPQAGISTDELLTQFGGVGLPTTLVIDDKGIVRDRFTGELSAGLLVSWLKKYKTAH